MGTPARNSFLSIVKDNNETIVLTHKEKKKINKRGTISYSEYKLNNSTMVFAIPHFVGNLRIGIDYKNSFNKFKDRCIDKINNKINRLRNKT